MCHQRWSQFAADAADHNNSTELPVDCKAGGPSAAEGTEPEPLCASTLVVVCSRLQQNNSTELPVDCKAGGPSAAESTEPAPLCAINAGRRLQQIAADCSRLQQNNSTELPVDCKAGGPSAAEGTEPEPLCASTLVAVCGRLQQIAAEQLDGVCLHSCFELLLESCVHSGTGEGELCR